jgi:hypothetical protein
VTVSVDRLAPYLEQLLENDDVRGDLGRSVRRARQAYGGAKSQRDAKSALRDRRVQQRLAQSAASARDAVMGVKRGGEKELQKQARRRRRRGVLAAVVVAVGAAVALDGSLRARVLGLFGGGEAAAPAESGALGG